MTSYLPVSVWPEPSAWATRQPEEFGYDSSRVAIEHWLDETRGGLWVQTFPGRYDQRELDVAFRHLDARIEAATAFDDPLGLVVDLRFARVGTPIQRRRIAQTFEHAQRTASHLIKAQAFVVNNSLQRGALTATLWLVSPSWPIRVFTDRLSAVAWVSARMQDPAD